MRMMTVPPDFLKIRPSVKPLTTHLPRSWTLAATSARVDRQNADDQARIRWARLENMRNVMQGLRQHRLCQIDFAQALVLFCGNHGIYAD